MPDFITSAEQTEVISQSQPLEEIIAFAEVEILSDVPILQPGLEPTPEKEYDVILIANSLQDDSMADLVLFHAFSEDLATKVHDFSSDSFKMCLSDTAPDQASWRSYTFDAAPNEIPEVNGYQSGGVVLQVSQKNEIGTESILVSDFILTALDSDIGPYRYAVIYNDTSADKSLIGYYDRGESKILPAFGSDSFDFDDVSGAFSVAV